MCTANYRAQLECVCVQAKARELGAFGSEDWFEKLQKGRTTLWAISAGAECSWRSDASDPYTGTCPQGPGCPQRSQSLLAKSDIWKWESSCSSSLVMAAPALAEHRKALGTSHPPSCSLHPPSPYWSWNTCVCALGHSVVPTVYGPGPTPVRGFPGAIVTSACVPARPERHGSNFLLSPRHVCFSNNLL